jgi:hypothetical protein
VSRPLAVLGLGLTTIAAVAVDLYLCRRRDRVGHD